ncbi:MAG: PQQ-binding-like beta-propeller repeat protein, partial [Armatimonadota bacterium]|nr:PQQ-binding-like beta-propeller repeat protein [Armatimonadota bacterium]
PPGPEGPPGPPGPQGPPGPPAGAAEPELTEYERNWPRFRGPHGSGHALPGEYPESWDGESGENIAWRAEVPLPGNSSPIVWSDRVFISGATEEKREVYAYDAETGELLWQREVVNELSELDEPPEVEEDTGFAAPTMATDGERVFAIFANGDVGAFDFDGEELWTRAMGPLENIYGHASSLTVFEDMLIVLLDQGGADDELSRLVALDVREGKRVWEVARPTPNSWTTPIVIESQGQPQLVTAADPWVIAYDPKTGDELWRADVLVGDVAPSPIYAGGYVIACSDGADLVAIRPDGEGDVTDTHVVWSTAGVMPDTASPVSDGTHVYTLISYGLLACYRLADGQEVWQEQLEGEKPFYASPTLVGDRLYILNGDGTMFIVATGSQFEILSTASLGEASDSSPAFVNDSIFIRGEKHLFRIGKPEPEDAGTEEAEEAEPGQDEADEAADDAEESAPPDRPREPGDASEGETEPEEWEF